MTEPGPGAPAEPGPGFPQLHVSGIPGIPEISPGDDLAALIARAALAEKGPGLRHGDIVVVTSKVVSKAEGRVVSASREDAIAAETVRVVARRGATTIAQTRHGLVLAAAGVDASNTPPGTVVLLPEDPDESARRLRKALRARLGAAGVLALRDHHGEEDTFGNTLEVTVSAVADEVAAASDLVKGKALQIPVAVVRGLSALVTDSDGPGARALVRAAGEDMFRLGAADVLSARRTVRSFTGQPVDRAAVARRAGHVHRLDGRRGAEPACGPRRREPRFGVDLLDPVLPGRRRRCPRLARAGGPWARSPSAIRQPHRRPAPSATRQLSPSA